MGDDPSLGEYEKLLLEKKTTARKELVLLHPERSVPPGSTRPWLKVSQLFRIKRIHPDADFTTLFLAPGTTLDLSAPSRR